MLIRIQIALIVLLLISVPAHASPGTEGAAFLDIPVGAGPAAMGAAYCALADNAYAPTLNPGGLGFLDSTQMAGQYLSYLESIHYEYASFVIPLPRRALCRDRLDCAGSGLGGSIQYLGSGDMTGYTLDNTYNPVATGNFTSYYSAFNLSYGQLITRELSFGMTAKTIRAKIDDVSASAYAIDMGSMLRFSNKLTLAAVLTNVGSKLTFLDEGDALPLAFRLGAAYPMNPRWGFSAEGVYPKTGLANLRVGAQWQAYPAMLFRAGYRTDTVKQLGVIAGFTLGTGFLFRGHEFSYAWVPLGDLGNTHYFSLVLRFGGIERTKQNLIDARSIKNKPMTHDQMDENDPEYQQLMQLFSDDNTEAKPKPPQKQRKPKQR
ncbi:MAG: PorV/PorQ family protein [Elusimicrobiota bacterium]|jgi:hypothetical protein